MVILFAIGAAFFYGFSDFLTRVGLRRSNAQSAVLFSTVSGLLAPLVIALYTIPVSQFATRALFFFVLAGIIGPFIARYLLYVGIERLGVSIASPLANIKPAFGALIAVLFLGEKLNAPIIAGTLVIIVGVTVIGRERSGGQIAKKWSRKDLIFPILASFCYGLTAIMRKVGMNITPEPMVGVVVQNTAALAVLILLTPVQRTHLRVNYRDRRAWFIFSLSGLIAFFAHYCTFFALSLGLVVIVGPLVSLNPFFALLLAVIFLRKEERVTGKILLGAAFIVGGTAILAWVS